jgi:hypothetical protein
VAPAKTVAPAPATVPPGATVAAVGEAAAAPARGAANNASTTAAPTENPRSATPGPEQRCANLSYFKNLACMERECRRSELQAHPECQKWYRGTESPANK